MKKTILALAAAFGLAASAAGAVTFSYTGTGETQKLKNNDLGLGLNGKTIQVINGTQKTTDNGLSINGPGKLTYTYLGFEAGNKNYSAYAGGPMFTNGVTTVGTTFEFTQNFKGLIDFVFGTSKPTHAVGTISNTGNAQPGVKDLAIGYYKISDKSFYLLFDDIASGDRDFDDIGLRVDVAAIPLPAGGLLLVGGLGLLAAAARRRRA